MHRIATSAPARCFGQRMLNPFRGVMHSVVTEWADAVTTDGRHWTLYVRGERLYDDLGDFEDNTVTIPDVKYGSWCEKTGFKRAPIRLPTFDRLVCAEGEPLLEQVRIHARDLPFPLIDRFELWLLHADTGLPLALIGSSCDRDSCESPPLFRWTPGQRCIAELPEAQALSLIIAGLAGESPRAQWFERQTDGAGLPGDATPASDSAPRERLPAQCFAPLFIDPAALDEDQEPLLHAVLHWQSPSLLQLPSLSHRQRVRFEAAACGHALRLAEQLPLYPVILDNAAITAALVEARLRLSLGSPTTGPTRRCAMSPDYIEVPDP